MTVLDEDISDQTAPTSPTRPPHLNEVHLVGKLSQPLQMKDLPSGDILGRWNLVVHRSRPGDSADDIAEGASDATSSSAPRRRQSHDTIECVSFDLRLIERVSDAVPGSYLEVHGALRRRFRRDQPGQSQYGVEAFTVAVVSEPPAPATTPPASDDSAESADHAGSADALDPWGPVDAR